MREDFGTFLEEFKSGLGLKHQRGLLKPSTFRRAVSLIDVHLLPSFGRWDCRDWDDAGKSAKALRDFVDARLGLKLAPRTILRALQILCQVHEQARDEGLIHAPKLSERVKKFRLNQPVVEKRPFTQEEANLLLRTAYERAERDPRVLPYALMFLTHFLAGMRIGEVAALENSDLDFEGRRIRVNKSVDWGTLTDVGPKTDRGDRWAPMSPQLADALRRPRWWQGGSPMIFVDGKRGGYRHYNSINHVFHRLRARAGLPRELTPHCLRHAHVTLRLEAGENLWRVSHDVGHSSTQVTDAIYARTARPKGVSDKAAVLDAPRLTNFLDKHPGFLVEVQDQLGTDA